MRACPKLRQLGGRCHFKRPSSSVQLLVFPTQHIPKVILSHFGFSLLRTTPFSERLRYCRLPTMPDPCVGRGLDSGLGTKIQSFFVTAAEAGWLMSSIDTEGTFR